MQLCQCELLIPLICSHLPNAFDEWSAYTCIDMVVEVLRPAISAGNLGGSPFIHEIRFNLQDNFWIDELFIAINAIRCKYGVDLAANYVTVMHVELGIGN